MQCELVLKRRKPNNKTKFKEKKHLQIKQTIDNNSDQLEVFFNKKLLKRNCIFQEIHNLNYDIISPQQLTNKDQIKEVEVETLKFIKDSCYYSKKEQKNSNSQWVIHPKNKGKMVFDIILFFIIISVKYSNQDFIIIPLRLAFDYINQLTDIYSYIISTIYLVDIVLCFNSGIYLKGQVILDRKIIAIEYLKFFFWIDLLSTLQLELLFQELSSTIVLFKFFKLLRLLRFFYLFKIMKFATISQQIQSLTSIKDALYSFILSLRFVIMMIFLAHLLGCMFIVIDGHQIKWFNKSNQQNNYNSLQIYICSLCQSAAVYWALQTMTSLGFGDIVPKSDSEIIYALMPMLITCFIIAYSIEYMGNIFLKIDQAQNDIEQFRITRNQMRYIYKYINLNQVKNELANKIIQYTEYINEFELQKKISQSSLQLLSNVLKKQLIEEIYKIVIDQVNLFTNQFGRQICNEITNCINQKIFAPYQIIIKEEFFCQNSKNIYIINYGQVLLFPFRCKFQIQYLQKNDSFGQYQFISNLPPLLSAKALTYVSTWTICRQNFITILKDPKFHAQRQKFIHMQFSLILKTNTIIIGNCFGCNSQNHLIKHCPNFHYICEFQMSRKRQKYKYKRRLYQSESKRTNCKVNSRFIYNQNEAVNKFRNYYINCGVQVIRQQAYEQYSVKQSTFMYYNQNEVEEQKLFNIMFLEYEFLNENFRFQIPGLYFDMIIKNYEKMNKEQENKVEQKSSFFEKVKMARGNFMTKHYINEIIVYMEHKKLIKKMKDQQQKKYMIEKIQRVSTTALIQINNLKEQLTEMQLIKRFYIY